jgi:hypothetical protein
MPETYMQMKKRFEEELNAFPMTFAFSQRQLDEALVKLGATLEEVCSFPSGGVLRKTDVKALLALFDKHDKERQATFEDDATLVEAMRYQLGNHEYGFTGDPEPALRALGIAHGGMTDRERSCFLTARKQFLSHDVVEGAA